MREHRRLALLILGPGTILPAALIALAAWLLLGLPPAGAAILGAALASTDPVLLRTLIRSPALPPPARLALRLESGINDVILLPIVVLASLALDAGAASGAEVARHAMGLFLLGPALGAVVGYVAITLLDRVRSKVGVRRDYESLYALGVAFTAFAAAESVGGSGSWRRSRRGWWSPRSTWSCATASSTTARPPPRCSCCSPSWRSVPRSSGPASRWPTAHAGLRRARAGDADRGPAPGAAAGRGRAAEPADHRVARAPRSELAAPGLAAGVRRDRGIRAPLPDHLPRGPALGGAARRRHRDLPPACATGAGPGARAPAGEAGGDLVRARPGRSAAASEKITIEELRHLQERGRAGDRAGRANRAELSRLRRIARDAIRMPPDDAVRLARELGLDPDATLVLYCT